MNALLAAIRFLTVLPLPGTAGTRESDLGRSIPLFPLVGFAMGGCAAALAFWGGRIIPQPLMAVVVLVSLIVISGALHLDGLADTADGFMGSRRPRKVLEIMRDSRVGAMGVTAIVCVLALKGAALASLEPAHLWRAALLMPAAGRSALVVAMAVLPYARPRGGIGTAFYRRRPRASAVWAVALLCLAGWAIAGPAGLAGAEASVVTAMLLSCYAHRRIGGATGDVLGAACELSEAAAALTLCAWWWSAA